MQKEELYDKIEKYLAGELSGNELSSFEQLLEKDNSLKAELELHRKLSKELGNPKKNLLNDQLFNLREEFTIKEESVKTETPIRSINWKRNLSIAATFLLLASAFWYFLNKENPTEEIFAEDPIIKVDPIDSVIDKEAINPERFVEQEPKEDPKINETPLATPQEEIREEIVQQEPKEEIPKIDPKPVYNFDNNADFEGMIAANASEKAFKFNVEIPTASATLASKDGQTPVQIGGLLTAPELQEGEQMLAHFFKNTSKTLDPENAIGKLDLRLKKEEEDEDVFAFAGKVNYFFNAFKIINVEPGLYYYTISKKGGEQEGIKYTGKFKVSTSE